MLEEEGRERERRESKKNVEIEKNEERDVWAQMQARGLHNPNKNLGRKNDKKNFVLNKLLLLLFDAAKINKNGEELKKLG